MKYLATMFCCLSFAVSSVYAQSGRQIFVAVNGSSTASGSEDQPVNNITTALKLADAIAKTGGGKIEILLRAGTYYIDATQEVVIGKTWTSTVPLTIGAYNKEIVILHGGKKVMPDLVKPVTDPKWLARFQPEFRNKIREIDLKAVGVDPGVLRPVGFGRPMAPSWMEVFMNGQPGQIARWPNKGTVPIDSVLNGGSADTGKKAAKKVMDPQPGLIGIRPSETDRTIINFKLNDTTKKPPLAPVDTTKHGGTFTYDNERPSKWKEPQKAWLTGFFMWGYADDAVPVKKIDTIRRLITTALPTKYGFASGKPWRAYYAYNIPEEIDVQGEYYVDSATRMLYFLPPNKLQRIDLSVLEDPMMDIRGVSNVTIRNIQFTCSRGMAIYMERTKGVRIDGCAFTDLGMMAVFMGKTGDPNKEVKVGKPGEVVKPVDKNSINIINDMYDNTVFNTEGGTDNGVVDCKVYNTGMGGIYFSGGDRLKLTPAHNFIKNCLIHDFNRIEKTYRPGIYIAGVGNTIANCEIYNSPSVAILLHGNNHVIEYNDIHNTTLEVDDMGAIYYGRDPSERGNIVRYNYFHNLGGLNKTMAIYHDDGACGMTVMGNVFYRAGTVAGFIGGGQDNNYINNVFLNSRYALHIDKRLNNWAKGVIQTDGIFLKRLNAVNYSKPPYSTAYPTLKDYLIEGPDSPQRNSFYLNLMVNLEQIVEGDAELLYIDPHNFETIGDPGFKNYRGLDFRIKHNAFIDNNLPGFVAPPISKMGYHKND